MPGAPRRVDANQAVIVRGLRQVGARVLSLAPMGHGCPDLLAMYRGELYLLEVKQERCGLTPDEAAFFDEWPGAVTVVHSPEEALRAINAIE